MASTNIIKWDDTANELTAYCDDDSGETEIGPAKWDDANDKLEINCNSTDFQVKWDDTVTTGDNLEARSVDDDCCVDCPADLEVTFSGVSDCAGGCDCTGVNGTYAVTDGSTACLWSNGAGFPRITVSALRTVNSLCGNPTCVITQRFFRILYECANLDYCFEAITSCVDRVNCTPGVNCSVVPQGLLPITNLANCAGLGDCGSSMGIYDYEGYGGTVTVTVP